MVLESDSNKLPRFCAHINLSDLYKRAVSCHLQIYTHIFAHGIVWKLNVFVGRGRLKQYTKYGY